MTAVRDDLREAAELADRIRDLLADPNAAAGRELDNFKRMMSGYFLPALERDDEEVRRIVLTLGLGHAHRAVDWLSRHAKDDAAKRFYWNKLAREFEAALEADETNDEQ